MKAQAGDWLLAEGRTNEIHQRRAQILEVHGTDGEPPYLVKWLDDGHEALVFPGPDTHVLKRDDVIKHDALFADQRLPFDTQHTSNA